MIDPKAVYIAMKVEGARPKDDHLVFPDGREAWLQVVDEAWVLSSEPGIKISPSSANAIVRSTVSDCAIRRGPVVLELARVLEGGEEWAELVQPGRDRSPCAKCGVEGSDPAVAEPSDKSKTKARKTKSP